MWTPSPADFAAIASWGLKENPFAAVADYSDLKKELRWLNSDNREIYVEQIRKRLEYIEYSKSFDQYYRKTDKPIDPTRWEYLLHRKAWFIMPLGWENFAAGSCRIVDLGCGDGDTVQRVIDWIAHHWHRDGVSDRRVHILGIDLNASRIANAQRLVRSAHPGITVEFQVGDAVSGALPFSVAHFDFAVVTGVLESLDTPAFDAFTDELCRITARGIYVEDLAEKLPGGYPRLDLRELLSRRGFNVSRHHFILTEPFDIARSRDPMRLWPVLLEQNLYAERT